MLRAFRILLISITTGCGTGVEISKSPAVFGGFYDSGTSSCYLLFKQDSTFEWFSGSALGAADTFQGKYKQRDSIIELDKIGFDRVVKSKRLLLTSVHPNPVGIDGNYLVQVDSHNRVVDDIFIFSVRLFSGDTTNQAARNSSF